MSALEGCVIWEAELGYHPGQVAALECEVGAAHALISDVCTLEGQLSDADEMVQLLSEKIKNHQAEQVCRPPVLIFVLSHIVAGGDEAAANATADFTCKSAGSQGRAHCA